MFSICIPSLKDNVNDLIFEIKCNTKLDVEFMPICKQQSAAKNRNECIKNANNNIIIMLDDDITGFYDGWLLDLTFPLIRNFQIYSIISARLLDKNKNVGNMLGDNNSKIINNKLQKAIHTDNTKLNIVCSAAITFFKNDNILFDENYKSAVYEDTDFCMQFKKQYPYRDIMINNDCKLIHLNEMKRLDKKDVELNKEYFNKKWNIKI